MHALILSYNVHDACSTIQLKVSFVWRQALDSTQTCQCWIVNTIISFYCLDMYLGYLQIVIVVLSRY